MHEAFNVLRVGLIIVMQHNFKTFLFFFKTG